MIIQEQDKVKINGFSGKYEGDVKEIEEQIKKFSEMTPLNLELIDFNNENW